MLDRVRHAFRRSPSSPRPATPHNATILSRGFRLQGEIKGKGHVLLEGRLEGKVRLRGPLSVGPEGRAKGELHCRALFLHGNVEGDLDLEDRMVIAASGVLDGSLSCRRLVVEEGGRLLGPCRMRRENGNGRPDPDSAEDPGEEDPKD